LRADDGGHGLFPENGREAPKPAEEAAALIAMTNWILLATGVAEKMDDSVIGG
jgi:hypothetical protein